MDNDFVDYTGASANKYIDKFSDRKEHLPGWAGGGGTTVDNPVINAASNSGIIGPDTGGVTELTDDDYFQTSSDPGFPGSANFNVSDPNQVLALQKQLFPDDESQWDGIFGPKTEGAYRSMVNADRTEQGLDPYVYEDESLTSLAMDNNEPDPRYPGSPSSGFSPWTQENTGMSPYEKNQAKRDEIKAKQAEMLASRDARGFDKAKKRRASGKMVWNKKYRQQLLDEANQ